MHPLAGKPAPRAILVDLPRLIAAYYSTHPDAARPAERVAFGTSGHRGSSFSLSFNEAHILAVTQAICEHRKKEGATGPLFLGMDTHALSEPAFRSALEVLAGNGVEVMVDLAGGYLFLTVLYSALAIWMLGLAVPVTASYIIAAVMVAPAMTKVGVPDLAAHMFIFYYAVLSEVSPPTALSPFAAAAHDLKKCSRDWIDLGSRPICCRNGSMAPSPRYGLTVTASAPSRSMR